MWRTGAFCIHSTAGECQIVLPAESIYVRERERNYISESVLPMGKCLRMDVFEFIYLLAPFSHGKDATFAAFRKSFAADLKTFQKKNNNIIWFYCSSAQFEVFSNVNQFAAKIEKKIIVIFIEQKRSQPNHVCKPNAEKDIKSENI
jgi:hypothetical protein